MSAFASFNADELKTHLTSQRKQEHKLEYYTSEFEQPGSSELELYGSHLEGLQTNIWTGKEPHGTSTN